MENWPQIWIPHVKKPIYQLLNHENPLRDTENIIIEVFANRFWTSANGSTQLNPTQLNNLKTD